MEGLKVSDANLVVYVHPSKATNVSQAILRELSSLLFKFSEIFDGVVLAYDVNTLSDMAKILPGVHPYFGKHGEEVFVGTSHKWHKIKVGTILRFLVKSFDEEILHISGSLVPPHTGSVRWLDKNGEDWSQTDRSSKKRKESEGRQQIWGHDKPIIDASTLSMNTDHTNKKSKKRRRNEDS